MSNNQLINEIQQLILSQPQDIYLSSLVFGDLEEPKYNNFLDFSFVESFQGNYLLLKYSENSHVQSSVLYCKVLPRKGSIRKIMTSKIFNSIYQYEKDLYTLSEVNDFKVLNVAVFRTGIYVGSKLKLTLETKGEIKLLVYIQQQQTQSPPSSHKFRQDSQTVLQVEDTFLSADGKPNLMNQIKHLEQENEQKTKKIESLEKQLEKQSKNISSQVSNLEELSELNKEVNSLRKALSQIVNIAQNLSLGEENVAQKVDNGETINSIPLDAKLLQQPNGNTMTGSNRPFVSSSLSDEKEPITLDPKTIEVLRWYQQYQNNPDFLEQHTQKVSETEDSFNDRRSGASVAIVLQPASNHSFLIYGDFYLFPRPDSKITTHKRNTIEALFESENFQSGAPFEVLKPAIVSKLSGEDDRWRLQEKGVIRFL